MTYALSTPGVARRPARPSRLWLRQLVVGLLALPLSAAPFIAYATLTPEGRLVRDRAIVKLAPPDLPRLSPSEISAAASAVPVYDDAVMVLAYHGIGSGSGEEGFVISADRFGEHLATLRAAGMHAVTADQVAKSLDGGAPLPEKAVLISFDDGRADAMMFADPLLEQAEMQATMFVITGAAAKPGVYYTPWSRLESYARSGRWDIQAHTDSQHREHRAAGGESLPALTSLERGESLEEYQARVATDLDEASSAIEAHIGRRPVAFAYPFGAYGAERTNDPAIRGILAGEVSRRYALAFHQDDQSSIPLVTADSDRLGLRRLEVGDWSGGELLDRIRQSGERNQRPAPPGSQDPAPALASTRSAHPIPCGSTALDHGLYSCFGEAS